MFSLHFAIFWTTSGAHYEAIESMIYEIRGQKAMLDFELAKIYGYTTKAFNQQVKNNVVKFPDRYRFQLTRDEANSVMSKKLTSPKNYFSGQSAAPENFHTPSLST